MNKALDQGLQGAVHGDEPGIHRLAKELESDQQGDADDGGRHGVFDSVMAGLVARELSEEFFYSHGRFLSLIHQGFDLMTYL